MLLLRLCPLIPFHGLNYLGGITGVGWETYTCSLIGVLPYQLFLVILGATAGSLVKTTPEDEDQFMILCIIMAAGVGFFIIAMIMSWRFTKAELKKVGFGWAWVPC